MDITHITHSKLSSTLFTFFPNQSSAVPPVYPTSANQINPLLLQLVCDPWANSVISTYKSSMIQPNFQHCTVFIIVQSIAISHLYCWNSFLIERFAFIFALLQSFPCLAVRNSFRICQINATYLLALCCRAWSNYAVTSMVLLSFWPHPLLLVLCSLSFIPTVKIEQFSIWRLYTLGGGGDLL